MIENDLPPDPVQDSRVRQARVLARKIDLLLDIIMDESGQPYDYPTLSAKAEQLTGYNISRTRWSLLKTAKCRSYPMMPCVPLLRCSISMPSTCCTSASSPTFPAPLSPASGVPSIL